MNASPLLVGPWTDTLAKLVRDAAVSLTLCAPFVSARGAAVIRSARSGIRPEGLRVLLLTDFSPEALCSGATDPLAVGALAAIFPAARTVHLPRLHAKVYSADGQRAVVTSANLTSGGLALNHECGLLVVIPDVVARIEREIEAYASLGAVIDRRTLERVCDITGDVRHAYEARAASASPESVRKLRAVLRSASDTLLRARLAEGPVHTVFARTIEFLLARHGPLPTQVMHPLVQLLHPDLCDDRVDREIDGKRFGKKWKHAVRTAQQGLKKRGVITLIDGAWTLTA